MLLKIIPWFKEHINHYYVNYGHLWKGPPSTSAALCKNFSLHLGVAYDRCFKGRYDGWSRGLGATWGLRKALFSSPIYHIPM